MSEYDVNEGDLCDCYHRCYVKDRQLIREGVDSDKVHFVGNVMIDTLMANRKKAEGSEVLSRLDLSASPP